MAGIFISYRRDDASGHAGRLFDRLATRFGREHVFMDVTDIAPGEDYTRVIETSVGGAEFLLAVIGPQWLGAANSAGARRLDEPSDLVRQEIAAGLERQVRVVPVLVRGARMPREEELPDALKGLARRQAVELTDTRWESDLALFEQALAERMSGLAPTHKAADGKGTFGKRAIAAAIVIGLVVIGVGYLWRARSGEGQEPATTAIPPGEPVGDSGAETELARGANDKEQRALPLPDGARFKLAGQQLEILALRLEPGDEGRDLLTARVRMTNNGPYADTFTNVSATLQAGEDASAPLAPLFELIPGYAAKEGEWQFPLPRASERATLVLRYADQETRVPLSVGDGKPFAASATLDAFGRPRRAQLVEVIKTFPVDLALPSSHSAHLGNGRFALRSLRLDRYNAERAVLEVAVQASADPEARGGINFWSDNVRLYVDSVPRAPENLVNEVVAGGASQTATFEFLLTDAPERLEVTVRASGAQSERWPIAIPGVSARMEPGRQE